MEPLEIDDLADQALLMMDSAPIIYFLESHRKFAPRFKPIFAAHAAALGEGDDGDGVPVVADLQPAARPARFVQLRPAIGGAQCDGLLVAALTA
jgi:hypothetical protein